MTEKPSSEKNKKPGLIARLKQLYKDRPMTFAFGVMGVSLLAFVLGGLLNGSIYGIDLPW